LLKLLSIFEKTNLTMNYNMAMLNYPSMQKGLLLGLGLVAVTACTNKGKEKTTFLKNPTFCSLRWMTFVPSLAAMATPLSDLPTLTASPHNP
jgi:hypothetical protein